MLSTFVPGRTALRKALFSLTLIAGAIAPATAQNSAAPPPAAPAPAGPGPAFQSNARVALLIDQSTGQVLFQQNADQRMPPASMAKMMTTHVAFRLIQSGELRLDRMCTVRPETWQRWHGPQAGSTMFLSPNEQVSVDNLLHGIVTLSGNDATMVLAECISGTEAGFVELMNRDARELGLTNSHWGNPVGWPDGGVTYTTARDLATLAAATIRDHADLYRRFYTVENFTWGRTMGGNQPIQQANRNPILGRVAGADGLKTGHTEEAGYGFTGSAVRNGRRLIMVVAGIDSFNNRITESVRLMEWGFNAWASRPLANQNQRLGEAQVQLGSASTVGLVAPRQYAASIPAGMGQRVNARIVYDGPVRAPIEQGQPIAELVVQADGMPEVRLPLVAEEAVPEAGFFGHLWASFLNLFGMA